MSEPQWLPYAGVISGLVGAATGIAGAVMGWIAYRRSNQIKVLDMRLELRKAINEAERSIGEANELLPFANKSRERVSAAQGMLNSGAIKVWQQRFQEDQAAVQVLTERTPKATALEDMNPQTLELKLAEVHKFQIELGAIVNRYKASVAEDDQHRAELRQAMLNRPVPPRGS
jgi:hypothetical protein